MRPVQVRLLPLPDVAVVDRDAESKPNGRADPAGIGVLPPPAAADLRLTKPEELGWWDWTVFLLHTAAEIEHALLVQYLYAAYSLADQDYAGPAVPADAAARTARWRRTLLGIAREEMAHLLTVQNLLHFVGGPLNLEREDFPYRALLYPFPLRLEPVTRTSLAKYVAAEMPAEPAQPPELVQEIVARAAGAVSGLTVNRVGVLYATLTDVFADPARLKDADLPDPVDLAAQAGPADWLGFGPLLVRSIASRSQAVDALRAVGEQGEGLEQPAPGDPPSHFDRFLQLYLEFPEPDAGWLPTHSLPDNPNTLPTASDDPDVERGRITDPTTRLWAQLCNVRYRMLLVDLAHALQLPGPTNQNGDPTPRGHLRDWAFQEMRGRTGSGLRGLAARLTALPLKVDPGPTDAAHAGPSFELPYTLTLAQDEQARWRLHRALLDTSQELIEKIQATLPAPGPDPVLAELSAMDLQARAVVDAQLT